jgi:hypothetical protein
MHLMLPAPPWLWGLQPVREMSIEIFRGGGGVKVPPMCKADNQTAICEPIAWAMRDPQYQTNPIGLQGLLQR